MEGADKNRFRRPGLQIESFPIINLPQTDNETKVLKKAPVQKQGYQHSRQALVSSKTKLQVRPSGNPWFGRNNIKRTATTSLLRNSRTTPAKGKAEPIKYQELYKISFPCSSGCATCAFSQCFGPVRVYVSQYKQPKPMFADDIRDSQGRKVIPRDRIREFRGLVYDKDTNSCYPPIPRGYTSIYLNTAKRRRIIY